MKGHEPVSGRPALFSLLQRLIERSRQAKPGDGQLAIEGRADRRQIVGADMRVHCETRDRDVSRRLVRLERPVDRRS